MKYKSGLNGGVHKVLLCLLTMIATICMVVIYVPSQFLNVSGYESSNSVVLIESNTRVPDEYITFEDNSIKENNLGLNPNETITQNEPSDDEVTIIINDVSFNSDGNIDWNRFPIEDLKNKLKNLDKEKLSKIYLNDRTRCLSIKDLELTYGTDYTFTTGDGIRAGIFINDKDGVENKKICLLNMILDIDKYKNILENEYAQKLINDKGWDTIDDPYQLYYEIYQYYQHKKYVGWWREKNDRDSYGINSVNYNGIEYVDCTGKVTNTTLGVALTDCYICAGISFAIEDVVNNLNRNDLKANLAGTYAHKFNIIKIKNNYYLSDATNCPVYLMDLKFYMNEFIDYYSDKRVAGVYENGAIKISTNIKDMNTDKNIFLVSDKNTVAVDDPLTQCAVNISDFITTETNDNPIKKFNKYTINMHNISSSNISDKNIEILHDTVIDELRKIACSLEIQNEELAMSMAVYMLGFSTYKGFEQCIAFPEYTDNEHLLKRLYEYAEIAEK